jgi:hypothetical protein
MCVWGYGVEGEHASVDPECATCRVIPREVQAVNVADRAEVVGLQPEPAASLLPVASLSARPDEGTRSIGCAGDWRLISPVMWQVVEEAGSSPASPSLL